MIDTHVHVVSQDLVGYPLQRFDHPGGSWVDEAPDADAFLTSMHAAAVDAAVLVQPHGAYRADNSYVCDAADAQSMLRAVAIVEGDAANRLAQVRRWAERGAVGLRLFSVPTPTHPWLADPTTDDLWELAAACGLTMGVCVLPAELPAVVERASRVPGSAIVLDHCGFAPLHDDADVATKLVRQLGDAENVTMKVTTHVIDGWRAAGRPVRELLPMLVDWFGAGRLVWGSDYAQTHDRSYAELVDLGRTCLASLPEAEAEQVAHTNAATLWQLGR